MHKVETLLRAYGFESNLEEKYFLLQEAIDEINKEAERLEYDMQFNNPKRRYLTIDYTR